MQALHMAFGKRRRLQSRTCTSMSRMATTLGGAGGMTHSTTTHIGDIHTTHIDHSITMDGGTDHTIYMYPIDRDQILSKDHLRALHPQQEGAHIVGKASEQRQVEDLIVRQQQIVVVHQVQQLGRTHHRRTHRRTHRRPQREQQLNTQLQRDLLRQEAQPQQPLRGVAIRHHQAQALHRRELRVEEVQVIDS